MCRSAQRLRVAALVVAALVLGLSAAEAQQWRALGPAPITDVEQAGRASALALSAKKRNQYWVGAASGGVWRSKNGGSSWKAKTDGLPTLAIGALALDPANEKVIYAGSGEANYAYHSLYGLGLYKSTNRGRSWRVLAGKTFAGRTFSRLVVSPADGDVVWAAVARAGGTREGNEGARRHPKRNRRMGIFRSLDGGERWKRLTGGLPKIPASDVDLDPENAKRIYASFGSVFGHSKNGIYRSTNGGESWSRLPIGAAGSSIGRISLAVAPADPNRIYALVARPASRNTTGGSAPGGASTFGVLRSDDGGDSWRLLNPGNPQSCCGQYYSTIAVHPTDPDTFVIGGLNLLLSTDGGASYRDVTPPHVDQHDAAFDAAGRLVVASDGGVHRTADLGSTWINRNRSLGTIQFYPGLALDSSDPQVVLGGTQDNGTNLRSDLPSGGSERWRSVFGGDGGWCLIDPEDSSIQFVQFQGVGNVFRSSNAGVTFTDVGATIGANDRTAFQAPMLFAPNDSSHLYYATQRLYESIDGGFTWNPIGPDLASRPWAIRSLAIAPSNADVLYAATSDGGAHVSEDGGVSWTRSLTDLGGWPRVMRQIGVDPEDDQRVYLADMRFGGRKVVRSLDRGANWESIAGDLPDVPVSAIGVHLAGGVRYLFAGTDAGVYLSDDEGTTWRRYGEGLPNAPAMDVLVDASRNRMVVSTLGRGMWTVELPG
ncbi:MAG: hypothetical protein GY769_18305 [bacterium]|nr:hypothetical protein [bacterium]